MNQFLYASAKILACINWSNLPATTSTTFFCSSFHFLITTSNLHIFFSFLRCCGVRCVDSLLCDFVCILSQISEVVNNFFRVFSQKSDFLTTSGKRAIFILLYEHVLRGREKYAVKVLRSPACLVSGSGRQQQQAAHPAGHTRGHPRRLLIHPTGDAKQKRNYSQILDTRKCV